MGRQVALRNIDKIESLAGDKGYDWWLLRQRLRADDVKPVIRHREFGWHVIANNFLQDDTIYHQHSNVESIFFALRHNTARLFALERGSASSARSS